MKFRLYQKLKNRISGEYRGYSLREVFAADLARCAYGIAEPVPVKSWRKLMLSAPCTAGLAEALQADAILFSFANYGSDYQQLLDSVMARAQRSIIFEQSGEPEKVVYWTNIMRGLKHAAQLLGSGLRVKQILILWAWMTHYLNLIDQIERIRVNVRTRAFVAFVSALPYDAILCQYFRRRGITSYCIQHGLVLGPTDYLRFVPFDVINIENLQADHLLSWGDFSRRVLEKAGLPSKVHLLAGNPKYQRTQPIRLKDSRFKHGVVCLARDLYKNENLNLLAAIHEWKKGREARVLVKLHPRCLRAHYLSAVETYGLELVEGNPSIGDMARDCDFAIAYNSTVYYEFYIKGLPVFRYSEGENDIPLGLDDDFGSADELNTRMESSARLEPAARDRVVTELVSSVCGFGLDNYGQIFDQKFS